ncbi:MAG: sulfotransferase domain-containing protein [Chloroflexota bacterium]
MADEFMDEMKALFAAGEYAQILETWGAETSNSDTFKRNAFEGYQPGAQDVIISTYPKSGTTWAIQIAYQIGYHGEGEYGHLYNVVPWPDNLIPLEGNPTLDDLSIVADSPTGLRIIKSHLEADYIPYTPEAKYISIIRDPKDMLVSMMVFENGFNQLLFDGIVPPDAWVDSFQTDKFMYQSWPMFINSWWALRARENVLVLTYEAMKADSVGVIQQIADFLGVSLTTEQHDKVIEKSSFAYMKANDHLYSQPAWETGGHVPLVRSGKSGNAKETLSQEQQAQIDAFCLRELEQLGSDFPYREVFNVVV